MTDHIPMRPSWLCEICGDFWPCLQARTDLLGEYDSVTGLAIYMGSRLMHACVDLVGTPEGNPIKLHERFLSWTSVKDWGAVP